MKHAIKYLDCNGHSQDWGIRQLYPWLISLGFTCSQSLDEQLVSGNVPSFDFLWKNGIGFRMSRDASYEVGTMNWNWALLDYPNSTISVRCSIYSDTMDYITSDHNGWGMEVFYDDNNFFIVMGGIPYGCVGSSYFNNVVIAVLHDSELHTQQVLSTTVVPYSSDWNYLSMATDTITFIGSDNITRKRSLRFPGPKNELINIGDYVISTIGCKAISEYDYNLKNDKKSVVLDQIKSCSYVPIKSELRIGDYRYFAVDSYTLIQLDD